MSTLLSTSNYQYALRTSVEKRGATHSLYLEKHHGFLPYTGGGKWGIKRKRRRRKLRYYENGEDKTRKTNKKTRS